MTPDPITEFPETKEASSGESQSIPFGYVRRRHAFHATARGYTNRFHSSKTQLHLTEPEPEP